jgi:hypothetical protein
MAEHGPLISRNQLLQVDLDFFRLDLVGQPESLRKPRYVRIHNHARIDIESVAENDIRCFATHSWKRDQFLHRARDFAPVLIDKRAAGSFDVLRLVPKQPDPSQIILQFRQIRLGEIRGGPVLPEEILRYNIDLFISALRGENRRDHQLKRVAEIQFAMRIRVSFFQTPNDSLSAFRSGLARFTWHIGRNIPRHRFSFENELEYPPCVMGFPALCNIMLVFVVKFLIALSIGLLILALL